jgi:hypothetical protein
MLALHIAALAQLLAEECMERLDGGRSDRGEYADPAALARRLGVRGERRREDDKSQRHHESDGLELHDDFLLCPDASG